MCGKLNSPVTGDRLKPVLACNYLSTATDHFHISKNFSPYMDLRVASHVIAFTVLSGYNILSTWSVHANLIYPLRACLNPNSSIFCILRIGSDFSLCNNLFFASVYYIPMTYSLIIGNLYTFWHLSPISPTSQPPLQTNTNPFSISMNLSGFFLLE